MKKLLATILALVMALGLCTTSWAAGEYAPLPDAVDGVITLGSNVTIPENTQVTIPANTAITLKLNEKTLTVNKDCGIYVKGSLTIEGEGTITSSVTPIKIDGGSLTLNSGKIKSTGNYGTYALNGGSVTVNGGEIESKWAALSGNNTTGTMNFEINGGTLTAEEGPAIYMPNQVKLTITNGTLNGGVSLRMGQVDISGGTINATKGNIDDPKDFYNYSGNAWLPDALYVFGGTYTSEDAHGNALKLNITGGTFNCENRQGSAVAIYDLGLVAQAQSVDISGNAVLKTNATDRKAYQVLSLADIGVTEPADNYGNEANVGKTETVITGGKFSDKPTVANGYKATQNADGTWTVTKISSYYYYPSTSDTTTSTTTKGSPKTFDAGVGIYAVTAVLSVTGMAWTAKKRH